MKKLLLSVIFTFVLIEMATAQLAGGDPWVALNYFLATPFMKEYVDIRGRAENDVRHFKKNQFRYSDEDIQLVMDAYNSSAEYFNMILGNIKADILDKEIRRYIVSYPLKYSKEVETDLFRAREYYSDTFETEYARVTEEGTSLTVSTILGLIPYIKGAIGLFNQIQAEIKKWSEKFLDENLIEPYRFKYWDEIK
ncbi:MAG: hypothetical protein WA004_15190 [Saprospiraceae bacterium]